MNKQRNLMQHALDLWKEAMAICTRQDLVDPLLAAELIIIEALRLEAAIPVVPMAHPLHD